MSASNGFESEHEASDRQATGGEDIDSSPTGSQFWSVISVALASLVIIVLTLGPSLVGARVFHGADALESFAPWRSTEPDNVTTTNPLVGDTVDGIMPARATFLDRLTDGDIALWQPYLLGGRPLAAQPNSSLFSPLSLPYWVLPLSYAVGLVKLLEIIIAVVFTALFLRGHGLRWSSGIVGGLIFAFSGFQVAWTNWPQTHVTALVAALFWSVQFVLVRRRMIAALPLAMVVAAMWLEGFPAVTGYGLMIAGAYALVRSMDLHGIRDKIAGLAIAVIGVVLGTALASIQLVPFVASLGTFDLGTRAQSVANHLPFRVLATFVVPNAFGSPVDRNYYGPLNYIEMQSFVGVVAMLLVVVGLVYGRHVIEGSFFWYLVIATGLVLTVMFLGGPLLQLLQETPLFSINFVGRMRSVLGFLLALAAAVGFEAFLRGLPARLGRRRAVATGSVILIVAGVFVFVLNRVWDMALTYSQTGYLTSELRFSIGVAVIAVGVLALSYLPKRSAQLAPLVVLPALLAAEVAMFAIPFWPQIPPDEFYPVTPSHEFLQANLGDDRLVAAGLAMYPGTTSYYGLRTVSGHAFHDPLWLDLLLSVDPNVMDASPTFSILPSRVDIGESPIFDRLAARYLVIDPRVRLTGERARGAAPLSGELVRGGFAATFPVSGVPRGMTVFIDDGFDPGVNADQFTLELRDASGETVASGFRRIDKRLPSGFVEIPVTRYESSPGSSLLLSYQGDTDFPARLDQSGDLVYEIVSDPSEDGLSIVYAGGTVIFERENAMRRIRFAGRSVVIEESEDRVMALAEGVDPDIVVLSTGTPLMEPSRGAILDVEDDGDIVSIDVRASGDGYVVIADTMQRDWEARVDGVVSDIVPADHALAAIPIPSGIHTVVVSYKPAGLSLGRMISLVTVFVSVAIVGTAIVRKRLSPARRRADRS